MATRYPKPLEILKDERWYGNGEPRWENASSSVQAEHRRRCCVKRLRRVGKGHPDTEDLADLLDGCAPGNRCMSGACPECSRTILPSASAGASEVKPKGQFIWHDRVRRRSYEIIWPRKRKMSKASAKVGGWGKRVQRG